MNNTATAEKQIFPEDIVKVNYTTKHKINVAWDDYCKNKRRVPKSWLLTDLIVAELQKNGVKLQAIGRINDLTEAPLRELNKTITETKNNKKLNLVLALSYGAREEIVDAVNHIIDLTKEGKFDTTKINTDSFKEHLYTSSIPDPDLLIRTSGEMRISNFLLWQISYSEIFITEKLWPDFNKEDLQEAIKAYSKRERRYGEV